MVADMNADAGRRYRLYPSAGQAERLTRWGHTCRAVWNVALAQRQFAWSQRRVALRAVDQCRHLTGARTELDWMADLPAQAAQQVLRQLDRAFDNWWNPEHPAGPPIFKKRSNRLTLPLPGQAVKVRTLNHKWADVWLPRLGWHVAFGVATGAKPAPPNGLPGCGVDFGVACSAFVSTEMKPRLMPATLTPGERRRLLGLERRKARQIHWARRHNRGRYSKRVRRTIDQIAKLRARQARRRADFTHKLTTDLAKSHGWVGIEDLRVKHLTATAAGTGEQPGRNVKQKAGLNRGILDNAPAERRSQLAYKAASFGSELRLVLPAGTSQTCAACGIRDPASRPGCGRVFACTSCGQQAHADANAAKVIELIAAGQAVDSTRSRPHKTARPSSRMREPSERRVSAAPGNLPPEGGRGCQGVFGSSQRLVMSGLEIHGENRHCFTRDDQKYVCRS